MAINQGAVYWVALAGHDGDEPRISHPHVVIQPDNLNHDPTVTTVEVCALTTNARKISIPGNILLDAGEANLPKPSIVEVSKVFTIDKTQLGEYIGTLSEQRINQILAGIRFVQTAFLNR